MNKIPLKIQGEFYTEPRGTAFMVSQTNINKLNFQLQVDPQSFFF